MTRDDHAASRAEPPASRRLALWVGAATVALMLGGLVLRLTGPTRSYVPDGIAGVKLGSTLEEARLALPQLEDAPPASAGYRVYRARTVVFDEAATCTLELGVSDRLSRIDCPVEASPGTEAEVRARGKLLATLRELYGKESQTRGSAWLWQNDQARLLLTTTPHLSLSVWSRAHEALRLEPPAIAADH